MEFNFRASHAAKAEADLAERETQQAREWERDAEEEMARIPALAETLEFLSDTKDLLFRPPSPPIVDLGEAEIVKNVRAGLVKDTRIDLQREWGGYDVPLTGVPNISAETKAQMGEMYEYVKRHDPQFAWVAQTVEDLPADIESGVQLWKQERERSSEGFDRFVEERSWESFSARDTLGTVAFGMCDAMGEDVGRVGKALGYVGTGIEYGKSYMRRGLRAMGMDPIVAQSVVNGAEGGLVIKGVADAARGVAAWRESKAFIREAGALGASDFAELAYSSRADKIPVWDVRGSGPKGGGVLQQNKIIGLERQVSQVGTPNAGGYIRSFLTEKPEIYYRVYSGENDVGQFLTKISPKSSLFAQEGLALPLVNQAEYIQQVFVPSGVRLQRSRALPAFDKTGGMEQFRILEEDFEAVGLIFNEGIPFQ